MTKIKDIFPPGKIDRRIEEVIKVDQADEQIIKEEIDEYILTKSIERHYVEVLDRYAETPNKPREGVGVWVSGFFGSGKSSFAKILGLAIENREICEEPAAKRFGDKANDPKLSVLLSSIAEKIPTEAVIFDVSTDRGIRGNQTLTEIAYQKLLDKLGYAHTLDLAELEIALEEEDRLTTFISTYEKLYGKKWDRERNKVALAMGAASRVMNELDPKTYPSADSWSNAVRTRADVSAGKLAERAMELLARRSKSKHLIFVIDEVGQFVARDVQKMLDLQGIVQNLGRIGRGRLWLVVTSQEKLNELVGGLDDTKIELARLMDRFPLQVHLEQSDISEVTSRRVLSKTSDGEQNLRKLFEANRGRLADHTRVTADIRLPELSADNFIALYPLLPYHIDLIIQAVSGLRTHGGASKHVGGANRTIIKLAQQLLINPAVNLSEQPLGVLARIDHIFDLVENNISSELRAKVDSIEKQTNHPFAKSVAKAICVLQFVKSIHRTAENIAAALHPSVDADSVLPQVKAALDELEQRHLVRQGSDGFRIPTPSEDDWERQREGLRPNPGEIARSQREILKEFWQPQPSYSFLDTKQFKASLFVKDRPEIAEGDIRVDVHFASAGKEYETSVEEARKRSREERKTIFWIVPIDDALDRESAECVRSREMLSRKARDAKSDEKERDALLAEERAREKRHAAEMRRLLKNAMLGGTVFFSGNERSPDAGSTDVGKVTAKLLSEALPIVFDRFHEAAARVTTKDRDALLTSENLHGLTDVFTKLNLLKNENGKPVFRIEAGALREVLRRIEDRAAYGEVASGKFLEQEFGKEPFGWDFDVVRLLVMSLLRAGVIEVTSRSQTFDSVLAVEAKEAFGNNMYFRQATFRPKKGVDFAEIARAGDVYQKVFGREARELEQGAIARDIRQALSDRQEGIESALTKLNRERLPGAEVLESGLQQVRGILKGNDANAITSFNAAFKAIAEAMRRASEIEEALTDPRILDLQVARQVIEHIWPPLDLEPDLDQALRATAEELRDLLRRETFFRDLPAIEQKARAIRSEHDRRFQTALDERCDAYTQALERIRATAEWASLDDEQRRAVAIDLMKQSERDGVRLPIAQLREQRDLASKRYHDAYSRMMQIIEGERLVQLNVRDYFSAGIDSEEQLDTVLGALRDECGRLIGAGKKILFQ